jgi:hypothetical protein
MKRAALTAVLCAACGADDLFISGDLGVNVDCAYEPDPELARTGEYDVSTGDEAGPGACARPYVAHLLVRNDNDEEVAVEAAVVRLTTVTRQTVVFNLEVPLPNPFELTVGAPIAASRSGVVEVEVIPTDYGAQLQNFVGAQILAEISLQGATAGGASLGSNRFTFPIEVCDGCRTFCESEPLPARTCAEDTTVCIDDGC